MLRDLFRRGHESPGLVQRVADLESIVASLEGKVKQLARNHDELDESTARRFKRIAARNAASGGEASSEGPATDGAPAPHPHYRMTWRERMARRRNGDAEVQAGG